jgi:SAM-dependent methyltransferase
VKRTVTPELLDTDSGTVEEVQASLRDLRLINRWFGGAAVTRGLVENVVRRTGLSELSLLDVGAGSGDIATTIARQFAGRGIRIRLVLLDRVVTHLPPPSANGASPRAISADAFAMPFRDSSFDLVCCALLVHHFEPPQIVRFLNEALRVARLAVLINDLRRSRSHLALAYAGFFLYRSRLTRHDGPASVRRAYTRAELESILRGTRAAAVEVSEYPWFRMGGIAWKQSTT